MDLVVIAPPPFFTHTAGGRPNEAFQFRLTGASGQQYRVEATTNLIHWETIELITPTAAGWLEITDPDSPNHPVRFYRAQAQP
ncbi:MAG TPA: hypothetical protein DCY13_04345 [Verrucomicrobiales bacterium]|nr:hypothetical protein [Verrucomicrobiales bacterium]